jgi:hypothetical protein
MAKEVVEGMLSNQPNERRRRVRLRHGTTTVKSEREREQRSERAREWGETGKKRKRCESDEVKRGWARGGRERYCSTKGERKRRETYVRCGKRGEEGGGEGGKERTTKDPSNADLERTLAAVH